MANVYGASVIALLLTVLISCNFCEPLEIKQTDLHLQNAALDSYSEVLLRERRQTNLKTQYESVQQNSTDPNSSIHNITSVDVKQEPPGVHEVTPSPVEASVVVPMIVSERPLLGVNGTGQRKDYGDRSTKPAVVSEPLQPVTKKPSVFPKKAASVGASPTLNLSTTTNPVDELVKSIDIPENETIKELENKNYTVNQTSDHHVYYNSTIYVDRELADEYWNSFKNISASETLSTSHRRAMTVELTFDFPFYGNPVRNITVATGGFLYTGDYVHSWLAATQYIAPLMANFDTSLSNDSCVKFYDNGTAFVVIWENVSLQDKPDVGTFTFSATLHKNGDIIFTYHSVPILINAIQDDKHPVKVGLSDAYIIDKIVYLSRRKTIYEYHRVNFGSADIKNSTIISLKALSTCLSHTDCESCINHDIFDCAWCPVTNRCSTGTDRKRQDWLHKGCDKTQIVDASMCTAIGERGNNAAQASNQTPKAGTVSTDSSSNNKEEKLDAESGKSLQTSKTVYPINRAHAISLPAGEEGERHSVGLVLGFLLPLCLVLSGIVWILYAYRNPHTKSGQLLIQYRPSQWSWRRGEARYTAATIHM